MKTNKILSRKMSLVLSFILSISLLIVFKTISFCQESAYNFNTDNPIEKKMTLYSNYDGYAVMVSSETDKLFASNVNLDNSYSVTSLIDTEDELSIKTHTIPEEIENIEIEKNNRFNFDIMLTGKALADLDVKTIGNFNRKVTCHPPIKNITDKKGKIALNMVVNRSGKVVGVAVNKERSTITDREILIDALKMSVRYRFESDYTAPESQYCRFTLIFDKKENKNINIKENIGSEYKADNNLDIMLTGKALAEVDAKRIGKFNRKVTHHAPIKEIAKKRGVIALNMVVNRVGKVVGVAVNKKRTSITDKEILINALKMSTKYRFEPDYTVPISQYCRFTFIFDLPE